MNFSTGNMWIFQTEYESSKSCYSISEFDMLFLNIWFGKISGIKTKGYHQNLKWLLLNGKCTHMLFVRPNQWKIFRHLYKCCSEWRCFCGAGHSVAIVGAASEWACAEMNLLWKNSHSFHKTCFQNACKFLIEVNLKLTSSYDNCSVLNLI